ncbi:MAG: DUF551 domain-containing protein [Alicycliphilus denitrificans]|nr:DUF551 domain-containing protein [Alicycliphilus denitrificans]
MTQAKQPDALRLADAIDPFSRTGAPDHLTSKVAAEELRRQHARIADLEAQLSAIGAGGVEPLRPRQCLHGISEPSGWRDIETAPKDGTYLLLWEQYSTNPFVGCWDFGSWSVSHEHVDAEGGWDGANVVDSISQDCITHWMKLPESPYGKN